MNVVRLPHAPLAAILVVACVLRLVLVIQGGQYFLGDEFRYDRGVQLYGAIRDGRAEAIREVLGQPEHALFVWLGAVITGGQHFLSQLTPYGDWNRAENVTFTMWLAAGLLAQFSVVNIFLVHRLARRAGASLAEANAAALLMAASNSNLYYARHLLPYDAAICAALIAFGHVYSPAARCSALACGLWAGVAYGLYNGYWYLLPVLWLAGLAARWGTTERWRLTGWSITGTGLALAVPATIGTLAGGMGYWSTLIAFSRTVTQGLYAEGWSLPWEYFRNAEGWVGVSVAAGVVFVLALAIWRSLAIEPRALVWLVALGTAYVVLVLASTGMSLFVVYARTVKPLVPICCLLGGWAWMRLFGAHPWQNLAVVSLVICGTVINVRPHFGRVFPRDVEIAVLRHFGNPKHTLSVSGSLYIPLAQPVTRPDLALVNAQLLYPVRGYLGFPAGRSILCFANPLTYRPFQYESHTPRERVLLRSHDISIRLIKLADPAAVPDDLPVTLRYQNRDRPTGH